MLGQATLPGSIASLGPIGQICWMTDDLRKTVNFWTGTLGVGPFFILEHQTPTDVKAYGKPVAIDYSVALGYWGDMNIEFIQQHSPAKTFFSDWLARGQTGPHHLRIDSADIEAAEKTITAKGGVLVYEKSSEISIGKYFDMGENGPYIEIVWAPPGTGAKMEEVRAAARNWDGRDPIRAFS